MRFERLWTLLLVLVLVSLVHPYLPLTTADEVQIPEKERTPKEPASTDDHQLTNAPLKVTMKKGGGGRRGGGGGRSGKGGSGSGGRSGGRGTGGEVPWIPFHSGGGASHHRSHQNGTNKGIQHGICLGLLGSVLLVLIDIFLLQ